MFGLTLSQRCLDFDNTSHTLQKPEVLQRLSNILDQSLLNIPQRLFVREVNYRQRS